jgi:ferricrocin synthase
VSLKLLTEVDPIVSRLAQILTNSASSAHNDIALFKQSALSMKAFVQRHLADIAHRLAIHRNDIETITPCTPLQAGLIVESIRNPARPYFNEFRYMSFYSDLDRLREAFMAVTKDVQLLRAKYLETDEGFVQVVLKDAQIPWVVLTHSKQADSTLTVQKAEWLAYNDAEVLQPIKIVASVSGDQILLVIYVHHCIYDGISWSLLLDRVVRTYFQAEPVDCSPRFTDSLPWGPLRQQKDAEGFWKERLRKFDYRALSTSDNSAHRGQSIARMRFPSTDIEAGRKKLGVSHQAYVEACFEVVLKHHFPDAQTYGRVVSGRSIGFQGAEQVIGPLFNTLPQAISALSEDAWSAHIRGMHTSNVAVLPYHHTALRDIRKWCGLKPSDPLFDVLFVFQHELQSDERVNKLLQEVELPVSADYPLSLEATLCDKGEVEVLAVAQSHVSEKNRLEALVESLRAALASANKEPDSVVGHNFKLPLTQTLRRRQVEQFNSAQLNGVHDFEWSGEAIALRLAIAKVAGIDVEAVDEHSTLFSLGLDSIDAVRLASRAKKAGIAIVVSKLLQAQTIPRILQAARYSRANGDTAQRSKLVDLERKLESHLPLTHLKCQAAIERVLPATPNQEALIADMLRSDWQNYYNHDVLQLADDTDLDTLKAAWQTVVDRSPILRTGFAVVSDASLDCTFAQIVHRPQPLEMEEIELETLEALQALFPQITQEVKSQGEGLPLLRLTLAKIPNGKYLVLSLAHAQYDGHSLALLHEDVGRAYAEKFVERPPYDPLIEESLTAVNDQARSFWENSMSGFDPCYLAGATETDSTTSTHRAETTPKVSTKSVRAFCQKYGVSLQALLQLCWAFVLAHHTRKLEVVFGVVLACRDSEEAEQIMFPAMNTVPFRAALHGSRADMLRYMQAIINDMRPYQRMPLRLVQALRKSTGPGSGNDGLFDTLFLYQQRPNATEEDRLSLYSSVGGSSSIEYPVAVEAETAGDALVLRAACKSSVFDATGTVGLLDQLEQTLESILETPDEPAVQFLDQDNVSLCGLPTVSLRAAPELQNGPLTSPDINGSPRESPAPLVATIRDVVAELTEMPPETIFTTATIEALGIDSISAIKVAALLRKQSVSLSVSEILKARTINRMAEVAAAKAQPTEDYTQDSASTIAKALRERGLNTSPPELAGNVETTLPATAGQVYMLSVWQNSSGQLFYPTFRYTLSGNFSAEEIKHAWRELVARHSILRTVLYGSRDPDLPVLQLVLRSVEDGSSLNDLNGPMATLDVEQQDDEYLLSLKIHHALYDAVSLLLLVQELQALLSGKALSTPTIEYEDFLAQSLSVEAWQSRQRFWNSYLGGITPVQLKQPMDGSTQRRVEIFKPAIFDQVTALESFARKQSLTTQALLFAVYAKMYATVASRSNGNSDDESVVIGIYLANRSHLADLDQLRAPTLNLVPLLVRTPLQKSVLEVAKQISEDLQEIGAAQNSAVSLWEIAEWTGLKIDAFVNFIKLPERNDYEHEDKSEVKITELDEYKKEAYARVTEPDKTEFVPRKELENLGVRDAYLVSDFLISISKADEANKMQPSMDIELTITNGRLDVGLFCPEAMLDLTEAEDVVMEMVKELKQLVVGSE